MIIIIIITTTIIIIIIITTIITIIIITIIIIITPLHLWISCKRRRAGSFELKPAANGRYLVCKVLPTLCIHCAEVRLSV